MNRITNPEPVEGQQQTTNIHPEPVEGQTFILSLSKKKNPSNPLIRGKTINNKQNYES